MTRLLVLEERGQRKAKKERKRVVTVILMKIRTWLQWSMKPPRTIKKINSQQTTTVSVSLAPHQWNTTLHDHVSLSLSRLVQCRSSTIVPELKPTMPQTNLPLGAVAAFLMNMVDSLQVILREVVAGSWF